MSPMQVFVPLFFIGTLIKSKSKKAGSIFDLIWSLGILVWALDTLEKGYDITLFGTIELPGPVFVIIIGLVILSEIVSMVSAFREKPVPAENTIAVESNISSSEEEVSSPPQ